MKYLEQVMIMIKPIIIPVVVRRWEDLRSCLIRFLLHKWYIKKSHVVSCLLLLE